MSKVKLVTAQPPPPPITRTVVIELSIEEAQQLHTILKQGWSPLDDLRHRLHEIPGIGIIANEY